MLHSFLSIAPLHQLPYKNILQRDVYGGVQGWETPSLLHIPGFCHSTEFVSCQHLKPIDNKLSGMRGASIPPWWEKKMYMRRNLLSERFASVINARWLLSVPMIVKAKWGDQFLESWTKAWESGRKRKYMECSWDTPSPPLPKQSSAGLIKSRGCQVLTWRDIKDVYRFLSNMDVLGDYSIAIWPNLWGAPHMSSFGFMAPCFPVYAERCGCPLDGQPGASKPLSVEATTTILLKWHHLSISHQWAAAGFTSHLFPFLYFSFSIHFFFLLSHPTFFHILHISSHSTSAAPKVTLCVIATCRMSLLALLLFDLYASLNISGTNLKGSDCGSVVCLESKQWLAESWTKLIRSCLSDWLSTPSLFRRPNRRVSAPHPPPPLLHYSHNFML